MTDNITSVSYIIAIEPGAARHLLRNKASEHNTNNFELVNCEFVQQRMLMVTVISPYQYCPGLGGRLDFIFVIG